MTPLAGLTACGAILAGIRSAWLQEPIIESFTDLRTWIDTVLVLTAATAAIAAPFTGIATRMTGELIFPLREGRWRVAEGQGRIFNHHWAALEQREAIDLVRISRNRRSRRGIFGQANKNFHAFGTTIVAPCEGTIVHVRDGLPDSGDSSESAGNHVVIDNGYEHILLAHMRSGTITVSPGDHVHAGKRIGEIGNSGNSTEPHLHLEVERNGQPLRVRFMDVHGRLGKGRVISAS